MATLFQECIEALGEGVDVITEKETQKLFDEFENRFPITVSGSINWDLLNNKIKVQDVTDIPKLLKDKSDKIFVLWDNARYPALKTTLENVLNVLDDVTAVSFETWLFSPDSGYVIEFYHDGEITLGFF